MWTEMANGMQGCPGYGPDSCDWHVMIPSSEYYDKISPTLSRVKYSKCCIFSTLVFECILSKHLAVIVNA